LFLKLLEKKRESNDHQHGRERKENRGGEESTGTTGNGRNEIARRNDFDPLD
jgi:hypothetical protein